MGCLRIYRTIVSSGDIALLQVQNEFSYACDIVFTYTLVGTLCVLATAVLTELVLCKVMLFGDDIGHVCCVCISRLLAMGT